MGTMALFLMHASFGTASQRRQGHAVISSVLGLFVLGRVYSLLVDGPTNFLFSDVMWAAEVVGAMFTAVMFTLDTDSSEAESKPKGN